MERFRLHILSFFFCLATVIVGCSQSPDNREFYALDELIDKDPRQGLMVVDSILSHLNVIDRHRQMEYSLLKYKAEDKCYVERQSDSTIVALFDYFQKHGSTYQQLLSYYYMGSTYRDLGDYPLSIVWYDKAEEYSMSYPLTKRDSMVLSSIFSQEAEINYRIGRYSEAFRKLRKSFSLQCKLGIDDFWTYQDMGRMASLCDSVELASKYYQRCALEMFSQNFDKIRLTFLGEQLGFYVEVGNRTMADIIANAILETDTLTKPSNVYSSLGQYYEVMKDEKQKALEYNLMAYEQETNVGKKASLSKRLTLLYASMNDNDKALLFAQRFFDEADSFTIHNKAVETRAAQVQRHVDELEASRSFKKETDLKNRIRIAFFIAFALLLIVISLTVVSINNHRKLKLMETMQKIKDERDRMSEQHTKLSRAVEIDKKLRAESAQDVASVLDELNALSTNPKKSLSESYWDTVFNTVDSIYPDFRGHLLGYNNDLQNKDLILLYLMKLGFKQADIARITKKARSVVSRKYARIESLLGVPLAEAIKDDVNH